MKAAVCYELGKPLVIEELDMDPPQKGEVKVRTAATAICHSDIHALNGELPTRPPIVGGHESAGYVEEVGEGVTQVKPGDPVVVSLVTSCGKCYFCAKGLGHLCEARWAMDKESRLRNKKGQRIGQMMRVSGFAEYMLTTESQCVPIPKDLPMDRACLLACGVITGFGSVVNRAKVRPNESVVVIGTGGVGLNAIQGAAYSGAYPIIAVDILDNKLAAARTFGATHTVNSAKEKDPIKAVQELTSGRGADYVFITVGNTSAVQQGFNMSGTRGMTVIVGLAPLTDKLDIPRMFFVRSEKTLCGGFMGSTVLSIDIPRYVTMYKNGKLKLDELITARYPLEKINEAIEAVVKGQALRNIIVFK
jgi:S-(hydroxymethyl)glutathione dehydrogenase / alcohol dehydrogenase